ncbi:alpha/beta fold hydrolase [Prauserella muralis]|uniref:Alpha/beta hydrolase n=1 Tax=Prauserella muralis TaxID=588067 RepID=A0A2V4BB70_9PSEU|nr:alpha/beta hydrolase [Prauserella muralis]PXY32577.1 alpha/beta hydrolase [Prauserella muralis]TWE23708.1 pimeloyl-ACP methyl ester carboxylesterase [Prauserella muralis]
MAAPLLAGIAARTVPTDRLTVNVLEAPERSGVPVVFVHGNVSSSLFWQRTMLALPPGLRPLAVDLRGFGGTEAAPVDATRGLADFSDDVAATLAALDLEPAHLVGWSLGGGVVLRLLRDHGERVRTVTLVNPVSPFGFGGTRGVDGALLDPEGAGSGAGAANPEFVRRLREGDRSADEAFSPRTVLNTFYVKPPCTLPDADVFVESMLSTVTGEDNYPGDTATSQAWPGIAPGSRGVLNALAPTHFRLADLHTITPKPPILWIRGADDQIVSDTSMFDLAYLGSIGAVPGWPGAETCPPQPMVAQTRAVLERYAAEGGAVDEVVLADTGHSPHIERPDEFLATLAGFLTRVEAA